MNFEHTEVWGIRHALRGMRNPKNSWNKSDSDYCCNFDDCDCINCKYISNCPLEICRDDYGYVIGENDLKLAQQLIKAGSEHRKFMRQIFVSVDITAPLYWWKEFDTYKVGTVVNSTSTMHKLATTPITLDCFEIDDYDPNTFVYYEQTVVSDIVNTEIIKLLETLRQHYIETKNKKYWKELIRWLPESWLQTRTVTMSYENLYAISHQRKNHKLNEWSGQDDNTKPNFISWVRTLPYAQELIFVDEVEE